MPRCSSIPKDPGLVRWYVFIPDQGVFALPASIPDLPSAREEYALAVGAGHLRRGNTIVWRRPATPTPGATSGRRLAVVR